MSTTQGTSRPAPATAKRQVYSPFEIYWDAFQEWRKRQRSSATLCDLSDDIGTTRGEIDNVASNRLSIREASDPPNDRPISGSGG
jgi:uncharacterized protein YjiS (DUF1127 family)